METFDPKETSNQKATNGLLEKSKALKAKLKVTTEKLNELKEQTDKIVGKPASEQTQ